MRSLLISLLLIITVVIVFTAVVEGDEGMKRQLHKSGDAMGEYIRGTNP
ncbi:hypothetical protein [Paenibacillus chungangensis]|uniref:Uncharacterized protein n=1 Tax=Paenibacillus chungangensis TaxID=696535 RepID=A0ABW3HXF6_9BACL